MITKHTIKSFVLLTKPGIVSSNMLTAAAGFFLALNAGAVFEFNKLIFMLMNMGLIVAGSCLINNVFDSDIDPLMERTQKRMQYFDQFTKKHHLLIAGAAMIAFGFVFMSLKLNVFSGVLALLGALIYIGPYTLWTKRKVVHGTFVGALSGSIPPLAGYVAQKKGITPEALMIYAVLISWQIAHFYAIGIYRLKDYQNAKIAIRPAVGGIKQTQIHIVVYNSLYCMLVLALLLMVDLHRLAIILIILSCLLLLALSLKALFQTGNPYQSAYQVFIASIISISIFSLGVIIDKFVATSVLVAVI